MRLLLIVCACLALAGCAAFELDNTASGGGKVGFETYHPCNPPVADPIGGGDGALDPSARDGGTIVR